MKNKNLRKRKKTNLLEHEEKQQKIQKNIAIFFFFLKKTNKLHFDMKIVAHKFTMSSSK